MSDFRNFAGDVVWSLADDAQDARCLNLSRRCADQMLVSGITVREELDRSDALEYHHLVSVAESILEDVVSDDDDLMTFPPVLLHSRIDRTLLMCDCPPSASLARWRKEARARPGPAQTHDLGQSNRAHDVLLELPPPKRLRKRGSARPF